MKKKIIFGALFLSLFLITLIGFFVFQTYYKIEVFAEEKVIYQLPYPGLIDDHPLYFLKEIRDKITDFLTRDYLKKANLYLLYSDKKLAASLILQRKGKYKLAFKSLLKGERYFLKIIPLLRLSKKQGVNPNVEFIDRLKTSNLKHQEIIEDLLKTRLPDQRETVKEIINLNSKIRKELSQL